MMDFLHNLVMESLVTLQDVAPIIVILFGFQFLVIRKPLPNLHKIAIGFVYVLLGMTIFLLGLEQALFPLGELMAKQLTDPEFLGVDLSQGVNWADFGWTYVFAFLIGFATTVAEPALIAVAIKAEDISGGTIKATGLRIAVAIGVAVGVSVGAFRIVTGTPLGWYIMVGYVIVVIQTLRSTKFIIPLAYDSGGVTTSTVTVPVVAALGLGLATAIPGRSPMIDGFGLIAFASLFPMMTVMGYAQLSEWWVKRAQRKAEAASPEDMARRYEQTTSDDDDD